MSERIRGWLFVAVQALLLVIVAALPPAEHWPRPGWLRLVATVLLLTGAGIVAVGAVGLGRSLTATPVPVDDGVLRTGGPYRLVRHPIYSGVLALVVAVALRSGNVATAAVAALTVLFFREKARWEEARLAARYPGYADYAAATGRFLPRVPLRRRLSSDDDR